MRYAILGDIHANYDALERVLTTLEAEAFDRMLCVGDVVGYGAEPGACIDRLRETESVVVAGNHDHAVLGRTPVAYFNPDARAAALWTRDHLSAEDKEYLERLPLIHEEDDFTLVHATLPGAKEFDYIQTEADVARFFESCGNRYCFVGHSHVPATFFSTDPLEGTIQPVHEVPTGQRAIVNVGSVGQPRDENPHAAFALVDTDLGRVEIRRVAYDVDGAARKIMKAGLPERNAIRLHYGR